MRLSSRLVLAISAAIALLVAAEEASVLADEGEPTPHEAPKGKPDYAAAKKHYTQAEAAAAAQNWARAAKEYGIAYNITRDPVLFFKLGNAYQLSGDCTRALEYFERYINEAKPSEQYQADTRARIAECTAKGTQHAEDDPEASSSAEPDQATVGDNPIAPTLGDEAVNEAAPGGTQEQQPSFLDEEITWQQTAAWTSVGVSVAFLTAGAVLGLSAQSREEDIDNLLRYRDGDGRPAEFDNTVSTRYEALVDEGKELNTMSLVALGLAGASAATAIVFFILDDPKPSDEGGFTSIHPQIGSNSVSVSTSWNF